MSNPEFLREGRVWRILNPPLTLIGTETLEYAEQVFREMYRKNIHAEDLFALI